MYAVKGGWVGQTFALARGNESEGKKSRVRRSKEERKAMAESFIKKFQNSNNGNFPSLNLTHKEVGGSFYTVREMVREIIQENRVLGPAKLSPEEQSTNQFLEQDPLGSIATEPQAPLLQNSNETHFISNHHQGTGVELVLGSDEHDTGPDQQMFDNRLVVNGSQVDVKNKRSDEPTYIELQVSEPSETEKDFEEELAESKAKITPRVADEERVLVSNGHYAGPEHQMLDNEQIINGSQVDVRNKNSNELTCTEYHVSEPSEEERNVEEEFAASKAQVNPLTEDIIVETFPLRTVTKTTDSLGVRLEVKDLSNPSEEKVEDKAVKNLSGPLFERSSGLVEKEALGNLADPSLESSNHSNPKEGIMHDAQGVKDLAAKVSCNDVGTPKTLEKSLEIDGAKPVNAPNGTCTKILNGTFTPETIVNETKADVQRGGNSQKGSNPTVDRIDLESLEGETKTSAKPESNPLLAIIQAFVAAFVKFWSD